MKHLRPLIFFSFILCILSISQTALCIYPSLKWTYRIKPDIDRDKIILLNDLLLLRSTNHQLHFVDPEKGQQKWSFSFNDPIQVFRTGKTSIAVLSGNILHLLDFAANEKIWSYRLKKSDFEKVLISKQTAKIAIMYGEKSYEIFDLIENAAPFGISEVDDTFTELNRMPSISRIETPADGGRVAIQGMSLRLMNSADEEVWALSTGVELAPTCAFMDKGYLAVLSKTGRLLLIDRSVGKILESISLPEIIDMRFWDEKPASIDNYSDGMLFEKDGALLVAGPSSISKVTFMAFPETISLDASNQESTLTWALDRAIRDWDNKNYTEALEGMQEVVEIWPDSSIARLFMGMALSTTGNINDAINQLEKALNIEPQNPDIIANLAGNYLLKIMTLNPETQYSKIEEIYGKVRKIQPGIRIAYTGLAELYLGRRDFDKAIELIEGSFNHGFFGPELHALLLSAYYMKNDKEESLKTANHIIWLFPDYDVPYLIKGKLLCKLGQYSKAIKTFEKKPPRSDMGIDSIFPRLLTAGSTFFYGNAVGLAGDYNRSISILSDYYNNLPSPEDIELLKKQASNPKDNSLDEQSAAILKKHNVTSHLELETQLDFVTPTLLAIAHFKHLAGDVKGSMETIAEIEKSPDGGKAEIQSYIGYLLSLNNHDLDKAGKYVSRILEEKPEDPIFLRNYAVYLTVQKDFEKAEETFKKALAINSNTELLHFEYGKMLLAAGRKKEAKEQFLFEANLTPDLKAAADMLKKIK